LDAKCLFNEEKHYLKIFLNVKAQFAITLGTTLG
jgi:hypothetical protein